MPKHTLSAQQRQQQDLARLLASAATAMLVAVLCVFPLYIDKFSNLGLTKFSGGFTLILVFAAVLGACLLIGGKVPAGRFAKKDPGVLWLGAFVLTGLVSTVASLSPVSSLWGLGGYYGGFSLVVITALAYLCIRAFGRAADVDFLFFGVGVTSSIVTVLYVLNIFNIDLIGAYRDTAVVERAQFFSTLGQKDFNAGFFAIVLPIVFYAWLTAKGRARNIAYGIPMVFGGLALAVVDAEALTLGVVVAAMVLVCHKNFDTRMVRRGALIGLSFFAWAAWMHHMRATVYTQGGRSLLSHFGDWQLAVPGMIFCAAVWALLYWRARLGKPERSLCTVGRVMTAVCVAAVVLLFLLANLWPGFPSLGKLDDYLVFNDDWGTYRGTGWRAAWGTWSSAPWWRLLLGYGPGSMHRAMVAWAGDALTDRMNTFYAAHNEYLEQLLTTGLLGLVAWVGFVAVHLRRGFRAWARPGVAPVLLALCSYLAQAVVSIRVSMLFPLVMVLFALLWVLGADAPKEPDPALPARAARLRYAQITLCAVAGMAVAAPLSHMVLWFLF
ncbi:O-antigen ligase family protein [Gemmiger formicilis]|uniref:O-antigen ligase family protein n=1 Tax=Gemmiger formicilis TaxID=745368 RepID=UPI001957D172|nr:O-antigen ligase family protein [Gemmiger formicilis]MBM6717946.1 O-antigen ligase family protein [Gemmiger formicilis]